MKHEPLPPVQSASAEARTAKRSHGMLAASVEAGGLKTPVRLRNVSRTGALIDGQLQFAAGTSVLLQRREASVPSKLVWVQESSAGLRFDHSLDDATLKLLSQSKAKAATGAAQPELDAPLEPSNLDDAALLLRLERARALLEHLDARFTGEQSHLQQYWSDRQHLDLVVHLLEQLTKLVTRQDRLEPL